VLVSVANPNLSHPASTPMPPCVIAGVDFQDAMQQVSEREPKEQHSPVGGRARNPEKDASQANRLPIKNSEEKIPFLATNGSAPVAADSPTAISVVADPVAANSQLPPSIDTAAQAVEDNSTSGSIPDGVDLSAANPYFQVGSLCEDRNNPAIDGLGEAQSSSKFIHGASASQSSVGFSLPQLSTPQSGEESEPADGANSRSKNVAGSSASASTPSDRSSDATRLSGQLDSSKKAEWIAPKFAAPVLPEQLQQDDAGEAIALPTGLTGSSVPLSPSAVGSPTGRDSNIAETQATFAEQIKQFVVPSHTSPDLPPGAGEGGQEGPLANSALADARVSNQRVRGEELSGRINVRGDKQHEITDTDSLNPKGGSPDSTRMAVLRTAEIGARGVPPNVAAGSELAAHVKGSSQQGPTSHAEDAGRLPNPPQAATDDGTGNRLPDTVLSGGIVNTARLVERLKESEINLNVRSLDFGNVAIHTAMSHDRLSAQISLERNDLGKALASEIPTLQSKLSQEHGIHATIELQQQSSSFSADSGQSHNYSPRPPQCSTAVPAKEPDEGAISSPPAMANGRLDIRI